MATLALMMTVTSVLILMFGISQLLALTFLVALLRAAGRSDARMPREAPTSGKSATLSASGSTPASRTRSGYGSRSPVAASWRRGLRTVPNEA
jgi:hypothetical protein